MGSLSSRRVPDPREPHQLPPSLVARHSNFLQARRAQSTRHTPGRPGMGEPLSPISGSELTPFSEQIPGWLILESSGVVGWLRASHARLRSDWNRMGGGRAVPGPVVPASRAHPCFVIALRALRLSTRFRSISDCPTTIQEVRPRRRCGRGEGRFIAARRACQPDGAALCCHVRDTASPKSMPRTRPVTK
jgi:hypothetical protein